MKRKIIAALVGGVLALVLMLWIATSDSPANPEGWSQLPSYVMQNEASVKKARIEQDELWIEMDDDGTRRDGFAEYLCQTVKDSFSFDRYPEIIIFTPGLGKVIGRANCE